jgi:hypothetical protein
LIKLSQGEADLQRNGVLQRVLACPVPDPGLHPGHLIA